MANIQVASSLIPGVTNTPLDARTVIDSLGSVESISMPYIGGIFYCIDTGLHYKITKLKAGKVGNLTVDNLLVDEYELLVSSQASDGADAPVQSVNDKTGSVVLTGEDVAITSTDDTSVAQAIGSIGDVLDEINGTGDSNTIEAELLEQYNQTLQEIGDINTVLDELNGTGSDTAAAEALTRADAAQNRADEAYARAEEATTSANTLETSVAGLTTRVDTLEESAGGSVAVDEDRLLPDPDTITAPAGDMPVVYHAADGGGSAATTTAIPTAIPTEGLLAHVPAREDKNATAATGVEISVEDRTYATVDGRQCSDGDLSVRVQPSAGVSDTIEVTWWLYKKGSLSGNGLISIMGMSLSTGCGVTVWVDPDGHKITIGYSYTVNGNTFQAFEEGTGALETDKWQMLRLSAANGSITVYNGEGEPLCHRADAPLDFTGITDATFTSSNLTAITPWNGYIADVRMYKQALTTEQAAALAAETGTTETSGYRVITAEALRESMNVYSKAEVDSAIGDINTILDSINGEVI